MNMKTQMSVCNARVALTRWCGLPAGHEGECDPLLTQSWPFSRRADPVREPGCVFCSIGAFAAPAHFVRVWPDAFAIVPLNPQVDGHLLVIPRTHVADYTTDPDVSALTMLRAAQLAADLGLPSSNIITSAGEPATQSVFHLHLHLLPREVDDRVQLPWHSGKHTRRAPAPAGN